VEINYEISLKIKISLNNQFAKRWVCILRRKLDLAYKKSSKNIRKSFQSSKIKVEKNSIWSFAKSTGFFFKLTKYLNL
jgi:hypothetical protein